MYFYKVASVVQIEDSGVERYINAKGELGVITSVDIQLQRARSYTEMLVIFKNLR